MRLFYHKYIQVTIVFLIVNFLQETEEKHSFYIANGEKLCYNIRDSLHGR